MANPAISAAPPHRVTINQDGAAYELTTSGDFIGVRLYDVTGDDALVHFERHQLEQFHRHLGEMLSKTTPANSGRVSVRVLLGAIARNFELLREAEKHEPAEVLRAIAFMVAHVKAWKPQAIASAEKDVL